jgi:phosphate transport system permease protein
VGLFIYMALVVPTGHFSGFAGSVALALLMFPVILRTTEDILNMVPNTLRESALALGMSRTRATLSIVCRSAKNGLLTGVLLSVARVSGETAPLLFTALFADSWINSYFTAPTPSLPVLITEYTTNSPFAAMHLQGWGAALVVMSLVLLLNLSARFLFKEK